MSEKKIKVRVRLVIIKNGKILLSWNNKDKYFFYIGGKLEFGETLKEACEREIDEECQGAKFTFKKILYIRDFILPEEDEHSVEFFILGDIDKFEEIDGLKDEEYKGEHWQKWVNLNEPTKVKIFPKTLTKQILEDYRNNFSSDTRYIEKIA